MKTREEVNKILSVSSYLESKGWFESRMEKHSINKAGDPIPWFTYSIIEFLKIRINKDMTVFEYGTGNSTLWWAKQVKSVIGCEHNLNWKNTVEKLAPPNVELFYFPLVHGGDYCKQISQYYKHFDIIVIDGRDRVNCCINSIGALKSNGVIILDNSKRKRYKKGIDYLLSLDFRRLPFSGMCPINTGSSETSIFYRNNNVFNI